MLSIVFAVAKNNLPEVFRMIIKPKSMEGKNLSWILRCATKQDARELSILRLQIDGESENLDRESGEDYLSPETFEERIQKDMEADRSLFLVAEVEGRIVGFARCQGNHLSRFRHGAEFGICIAKEYWGNGIGKALLQNILEWADNIELERIELSVVETNTGAISLYRSFGFIEEGLLRKNRLHKDGSCYSTVIMGRLKSDAI